MSNVVVLVGSCFVRACMWAAVLHLVWSYVDRTFRTRDPAIMTLPRATCLEGLLAGTAEVHLHTPAPSQHAAQTLIRQEQRNRAIPGSTSRSAITTSATAVRHHTGCLDDPP